MAVFVLLETRVLFTSLSSLLISWFVAQHRPLLTMRLKYNLVTDCTQVGYPCLLMHPTAPLSASH